MQSGETLAWEKLNGLDPAKVCAGAEAVFEPSSGVYALKCLGQSVRVSVPCQEMTSDTAAGEFLLRDLSYLSRLSILQYLIHAKQLPLSGRWVKPHELPGGEMHTKGAHRLPLDRVAGMFEAEADALDRRAVILGAKRLSHGDYAVQMDPFPRIPLAIVVWAGDSDFPANAAVMFDSTCCLHLAPDILWATAMMTLEMVLCPLA